MYVLHSWKSRNIPTRTSAIRLAGFPDVKDAVRALLLALLLLALKAMLLAAAPDDLADEATPPVPRLSPDPCGWQILFLWTIDFP